MHKKVKHGREEDKVKSVGKIQRANEIDMSHKTR